MTSEETMDALLWYVFQLLSVNIHLGLSDCARQRARTLSHYAFEHYPELRENE